MLSAASVFEYQLCVLLSLDTNRYTTWSITCLSYCFNYYGLPTFTHGVFFLLEIPYFFHVSILQENLKSYVKSALEAITASGLVCPTLLRDVFCVLKEMALKHYPGMPNGKFCVIEHTCLQSFEQFGMLGQEGCEFQQMQKYFLFNMHLLLKVRFSWFCTRQRHR